MTYCLGNKSQRQKNSPPRRIGLQKTFTPWGQSLPYSVCPQIRKEDFKKLQSLCYSMHIHLETQKKFVDLRDITATMMVHVVPPVLSRSFDAF